MEIQKLFVSLLLDAADYTGGLDDAQKEASSFRDRISQTIGDGFKIAQGVAVAAAAAIAVAVVGIGAAAFSVSNDVATATANIQAELGTTAEEAERLGDIATDVWGNNFAGSITEAAGAVGLIRQQLGDMSDNELQRATENAFRLQDVFGVEVPESVDAARTLMEQFGLTSEEAFDFIAKGFQNGLNRSDDFLDTIGEYSVQFASGGADAGEFFSLLESGMQGGMLGTDKAADAFKEFRVRIQDGSTLTAESLEAIGISSEELLAGMQDGTVSAADAFSLVMDALNNVDDENLRMQAGVGLLGTQFEDLGTAGALGLSLIGTELSDMTGAVGSLDAKYNTLGSAVEGYRRKALLALKPIGDVLLNIANSAMPLVDQAFAVFETTIAPAIELVAGIVQSFLNNLSEGMTPLNAFIEAIWDIAPPEVLDFLVRLRDEILPALVEWFNNNVQPIIDMATGFVSWKDVLIALGILLASVILPILGSLLLSILAIAAPVLAIIAVVALLRTAWEENWGGIQEKTAAAVEFVRGVITTVIEGVRAFWEENGDAIKAKAEEIWEGIKTAVSVAIEFVRDIVTDVATGLQAFWDEHGEAIMETARLAWEFIQESVQTAVDVIKDIFAAFKSAFEGDWTAFGEHLRDAWDTAWEFIKTTISDAGAAILEVISGLILDLIAKFQDTDWGALGKNIIDGLVNGLNAARDAVIQVIVSIAAAAEDAIKAFFGISSPSRLMYEIGENIGEGLVRGIKSKTASVSEAMKELFSTGGGLSGIAGGFASELQNSVFPQLEAAIQDQESLFAGLKNKFVDSFGKSLGIASVEDLNQQRLVSAYFAAVHSGNKQMENDIQAIWVAQAQLTQATTEYEEAQADVLALQKAQSDLAFLEQQQKLLDLISEHGLNAKNILGGLELGLGADTQGLVQAMTRAIQAIVDQANEQLDINSPSGVFEEIGQFAMRGLAAGLGDVTPIQRSVADLVNELTLPFGAIDAAPITSTATAVSAPTPFLASNEGDTFVFNIDAPGGDETAIEKAVERAMARHGRRADTRIRTR